MSPADVRTAALAAHRAGLCVIPVLANGTKKPPFEWKAYQHQRPTEQQLLQWYRRAYTGMAVITGHVSGGLEALDFDDDAAYQDLKAAAGAVGLGALVERIEGGYLERTPNGGAHWLYRCEDIAPNQKLARRPKRPEEMRHEKDLIKVLIETRGEGGYVVVAPSHGGVHETGRPNSLVSGGVDTIVRITPEERRSLFALALQFDLIPARHARGSSERRRPTHRPGNGIGNRPGDVFSRTTSWAEILVPHGWTFLDEEPDAEGNPVGRWCRPGKRAGIGATTNFGGADLLYAFTSSSQFEPETWYSKFGAYAVLNHGGDYDTAAEALAARGMGTKIVRTSRGLRVRVGNLLGNRRTISAAHRPTLRTRVLGVRS